MNWSVELGLRQQRKKGTIPVDIFDIPLTDGWLTFRYHHTQILTKLWLQKHVIAVRPVVHPIFARYMWRFRLRKILVTQLKSAWIARRVQQVHQHLGAVKDVLRVAVAAHIWRRRFSKILRAAEPNLYWKAYRRWHPEELEEEAEEVDSFFNIGAFDDE
ncbi:hypothetical protein ON010_g17053 [Phytophthora cinnamomi]|nr:hypothetical protein ON010_g17053 [Phytophthora cinnamomi]